MLGLKQINHYFQSSLRYRLIILLPLVTLLFWFFPAILSILYLEQGLSEGVVSGSHYSFIFIFISLVFLIAQVLLTTIIVYKMTEPLIDLTAKLKTITDTRQLSPLQPGNNTQDEIGVLINSFNDMTSKIKSYEEELQHKSRLAAIGQLAAEMAHEIRNPLNIITMFSDMLPQHHLSGEFVEKFVGNVPQATIRIGDLVQDLLKATAPEKLDVERLQTIPLATLLEHTLQSIKNGSHPGVKVETKIDPHAAQIFGDKTAVQRILENLLSNALQAMTGNTGILSITTTPTIEKSTPFTVMTIKDTGPGMTKDQMERIFDPYFTTKSGGTGLGLTIVHKLVQAHRGRIEVQSEVNKGTIFNVYLPSEKLPAEELKDNTGEETNL